MVTEQTKPVPKLLDWARRLQAIAQTGVAYPQTHIYDRERYAQVRQVAAEMFAADGEVAPVDELLALETGQATPKLDVRGVVFRGDTILLVREEGAWSLPGGWVDVGESPTEAAVREVLEESGYETRAVKLLALLDRDRHDYEPHAWHIWKAIVLCELLGDDQRPLVSETDAARFFTRSALPEPLRSGDATRALVERAFEHLEHPEWPADLD
jgi:ADP-ribose pyrophosphatase YjhB (NUDIX family)